MLHVFVVVQRVQHLEQRNASIIIQLDYGLRLPNNAQGFGIAKLLREPRNLLPRVKWTEPLFR